MRLLPSTDPQWAGGYAVGMADEEQLIDKLVRWRSIPVVGKLVRYVLRVVFGTMLPDSTYLGEGTRIVHGNSTNLHPKVVVGRNCMIFQNTSVGRSNIDVDEPEDFIVVVEDFAVISTGVVVAAPDEGLVVGEGTLVAANSVLKESTGEWEIWGGIPARKIGERSNRAEILASFGAHED